MTVPKPANITMHLIYTYKLLHDILYYSDSLFHQVECSNSVRHVHTIASGLYGCMKEAQHIFIYTFNTIHLCPRGATDMCNTGTQDNGGLKTN